MMEPVTPLIRRLRAPNPSPLTGTGTNTYLVGTMDLAVIDPGPDLPDHQTAILGALSPGQRISHILVTHAHHDHSALAPLMSQATGAPIFAYGTALDGRSARMSRLAPVLPTAAEGLDRLFRPDHRLVDGESITGPDWQITAIHTPGHLGGHICFALGDTLFSGDHVMGWSTTLVSPPDGDMGDYMTSLRRLQSQRWSLLLPGHGDPVTDPADRIATLIAHRLTREAQILAALTQGPGKIPSLAAHIYHDTPAHLLPAAERNVLAHLIDLAERNLVIAHPALHPDAEFRLT